jgi:hypothetical protein
MYFMVNSPQQGEEQSDPLSDTKFFIGLLGLQATVADPIQADLDSTDQTGGFFEEALYIHRKRTLIQTPHVSAFAAIEMRMLGMVGSGYQAIPERPVTGADPRNQLSLNQQVQNAINSHPVDRMRVPKGPAHLPMTERERTISDDFQDPQTMRRGRQISVHQKFRIIQGGQHSPPFFLVRFYEIHHCPLPNRRMLL